jgi:large subunit ribosomal protein L2
MEKGVQESDCQDKRRPENRNNAKINMISPKDILTRKEPEKNLLVSFKQRAGRSNTGRITVRHQGGGVKRLYRIVDFGQNKINIPGKVAAIEYDPFRTAYLALLEYQDKDKRYVLAPDNIKIGDEIICADKADIKIGNRMKLKNIPVGISIFNIELIPGLGGKMARSAGSSVTVLAYEDKYCNLQLSSGEIRRVSSECFATIGAASRPEWRFVIIGKAGSSRLKGRRPGVRGTVMNPCDHPHGGGEGRTPRGMKYPKTPWGKHALGVKTRGRKWTDKYIIQRRIKEKDKKNK